MFDDKTLDAIIALADHRSFRAAATKLKISNATLTRVIQGAEKKCGFKIFERSSNGVLLTILGHETLEYCTEYKKYTTDFNDRIINIERSADNRLKLGCGPLTTATVLRDVLPLWLEESPHHEISITVSARFDLFQDFSERKLDLFIGELSHTASTPDLQITNLKKQDVIIVAGPDHPIHQDGPVTIDELLSYPQASPHLPKYWQNIIQKNAPTIKLPYRPRIECDDYSLLVRIASRSRLVLGGLPEHFEKELQSGELIPVKLAVPLKWNICAAKLAGVSSHALNSFWKILEEKFFDD